MNKSTPFLFLAFWLITFSACRNSGETNHPDLITADSAYYLVNPFIGTGGHGHTYPGATLPFGMVQLSPDTRIDGWDGVSGYHFTDSIIYGFSHTHLSGTGVGDYADVLLMPSQGNILFNNGKDGNEGYRSSFNKKSEIAQPGYYAVKLDKHDIDVRLTATPRVGIHEYTFNQGGDAHIIIDLEHRDELLDWRLEQSSPTQIIGHRISKAWAKEQHLYFVLGIDKDIEVEKNGAKWALKFNVNPKEKVMVKVAISSVHEKGAILNMQREASFWDFDSAHTNARQIWEKALTKIEVKGTNRDDLSIFYTSLYHSMLAPNIFNDQGGQYRGMDQEIHNSDNTSVYTVFSLWDTFRATHPLFTIIERERTLEFIQTFLNHYKQGGRLPVWELACNETDCMIGYHSVSVIADAYSKGIRSFDHELALEAMIHSASLNHFGLDSYKNRGYIAADDESESVSKTLEYAYDDWCIAQFAGAIGKTQIADSFYKRSQNYRNIFNPETGFMQSKMNGRWNPSFDPTEVNFNFTEANSWQYSFFVPHDISGLIDLHQGQSQFENKLDELFETSSVLKGRHQSDITGLIGQYAHGNEPSHHMAYLYNYIGKPWKTQERVAQIMNTQYSNKPDGLSGNEDCGQMSSWYVMSAMGLYAVNPGSTNFVIGTPNFEEMKINLENGNTFLIKALNLSKSNIYVQSIELNGKRYSKSFLPYLEILNGGQLIFHMGDQPQKEFFNIHPESKIVDEYSFLPSPYFNYDGMTFSDSLKVEIKSVRKDAKIFYSVNDEDHLLYDSPLILNKTSALSSFIEIDGRISRSENAVFRKVKGGRSIELLSEYSNQYNAGGNNALIDYLEGSRNFRTGFWQGFQGQDVEAIVDLGEVQNISAIKIGALQDIQSWIWLPPSIELSTSADKVKWHRLDRMESPIPRNKYGAIRHLYSAVNSLPARYVRFHAEYPGDCPEWHLGAGGKAWIFLDEIWIE